MTRTVHKGNINGCFCRGLRRRLHHHRHRRRRFYHNHQHHRHRHHLRRRHLRFYYHRLPINILDVAVTMVAIVSSITVAIRPRPARCSNNATKKGLLSPQGKTEGEINLPDNTYHNQDIHRRFDINRSSSPPPNTINA